MTAILEPGERTLGIGIDVGGTFTDAALTDGINTWRAKALTTPVDPARGVLDGCHLLAQEVSISLEALLPAVGRFSLATTAITNVLASGTGGVTP